MDCKILVLGDTHARRMTELPLILIKTIEKVDWVIHVGDFTSEQVLNKLIELKNSNFYGVYGNSDPMSIRKRLPSKNIVHINNVKIGFTHPVIGGSSSLTEKRVLAEFKDINVDVIIYGHTHEAKIKKLANKLIINPGKGYLEENTFGPRSSYAILTLNNGIKAEIKKI
jgi:putative phosphoesterase